MKHRACCVSMGLLLIIMLSCADDPGTSNDGCGASRIGGTMLTLGANQTGGLPVAGSSQTNFANTPGEQASISWKLELKNICTKKHSYAEVSFTPRKAVADEVQFKAVI